MRTIEYHEFDTTLFPLRELFCSLQKQYCLEKVHLLGGFDGVGDTPGNDNNSFWHDHFYNRMKKSDFMDCYNEFMKIVIRGLFDEPLVYQRYPTLRYQIPLGKGVAAYHVDSDYNHPIEERNIWLPLTKLATGTRSIWIESEPGKGDYKPVEARYGEFIMFDGGKLSHGNEVNTTDETRVSIDMRVIPMSKWKPSPEMKGLSYGKARIIGEDDYYGVID